jgi:hypothetical protein
MALPITAVTSTVYWPRSMMALVSPNSAEMVPNVKPVDISRVVYMPSRGSKRKARVSGKMPTNLVAILMARRTTISPAAPTIAGKSTSEPALRK